MIHLCTYMILCVSLLELSPALLAAESLCRSHTQDIVNIRARLTKSNLDVDVRKAAELNIDNLINGKASDKEVCNLSCAVNGMPVVSLFLTQRSSPPTDPWRGVSLHAKW